MVRVPGSKRKLGWFRPPRVYYNPLMVRPSRARFLMAERPEPLMLSLPRPAAHVFDLFQRIAVPGRPSFLLESGKGSEALARYAFMGSDPYLVLSGKGCACELRAGDRTVTKEIPPFRALAGLLRASRVPRPTFPRKPSSRE